MAIDIEDGYESIGNSITKNKTYKQISLDYKKLKKKAGSSYEKNKKSITQTLNNAKKKKQKYQKSANSQIDNLMKLKLDSGDDLPSKDDLMGGNFKKLKDSKYNKIPGLKIKGKNSTQKYIINKFVTELNELKPKILELIEQEILNAAGCSQDQTYTPNQDLYLKVKSIDLLGQLMVDPNNNVGQIIYEDKTLSYPGSPFPMNKELYNRIQNINQPFSVQYSSNYQGKSGQNLFDITYVENYVDSFGNNVTGNFYKVNLSNRLTGNKIKEFLKDYYSTIEVIDFKNIFANLMNQLTGAVSIEKGDGKSDLEALQKVFILLQRIMGLCYDNTKEIDVSGTAKVSENDNIDDSFFEFTEIDLNFIDQNVSDIINGVATFEECNNVQLPINTTAIVNSINNLVFVPGTNNNNTLEDATNITDTITKNPDWLPLQINLDASFIKEFPKSVVLSLLSPKTLLPLGIVLKAVNQNVMDEVFSYVDFIKKLKTFFTSVVSKIGAIFIKIIFDSIKEDIKQLLQTITIDIANEKVNKKLSIILALTQIILAIAKLVKDFRECKSVIDDLQNLLKLASKGFGNQVPLPLLLASRFLSGFSSTRAFLNVIEEFEKLGIPTGPMSDGSPNKFMASIKAVIDGIDKEESQNGQVQVAVDLLSITPIGQTIPKVVFGKKL